MDAERVLTLERWRSKHEREELRELEPASEEVLVATIQALADEFGAVLSIDTGDRWQPGARWLVVSASEGIYAVKVRLDEGIYDLVGDPVATGTIRRFVPPAAAGAILLSPRGDVVDFPRRHVVSREQALAAVLEFFRTGTVDIAGGGWEEERVLDLARYGLHERERELWPACEEVLADAIRSMGDGQSATLEVRAGRWLLAVAASEGMFSVSASLGEDIYERYTYPGIVDTFDLVGDPAATGIVPFDFGGQGGECPRRYVVSLEQALTSALEFFRSGTVDVVSGHWERQGPGSAWEQEGMG